MKRLELVIVQFEEVKRLIEVGRVPQLRLAHILLDSAVELIMHRMAEAVFDAERFDFDRLQQLRRLEAMRKSDKPLNRKFGASGPSDDELRADIQRLEKIVTSTTQRKKTTEFGKRIDFLVGKKKLPEDLAPVLKKLHDYRNETYHRDQHRVEVIRPAVLIYFDAACTVLDHYELGMLIGDDSPGPELARFQDGTSSDRQNPFELPQRVAKQLREEVGLDLRAVRTALVDHLLGRLDDLESGLAYIEENTSGGAIPGDGIRSMQIEDDDLEAIFDKQALRSRKYPLTMKDVRSWIERATAMEGMEDKHALFAELAALEDAFEDLEQKVRKAVWVIDEAANMR
ncbi:hypothetical protein [Streptomyces cyanogenus]|uniref:Uncharacterized protein n=1 Tax=Streptomyces cyanogenus TaxID=80860 RepID=A0ABX7TJY8_STRCY|nr:hypothetical protein [Streptomyces cyanogenus]QTD95776.1 hypothetical protein S1361_00390 [Streptomyces cyanogenus]QTE03214.1 hypothetical protein S1361_38110 [Streptomyces cyanogenus]